MVKRNNCDRDSELDPSCLRVRSVGLSISNKFFGRLGSFSFAFSLNYLCSPFGMLSICFGSCIDVNQKFNLQLLGSFFRTYFLSFSILVVRLPPPLRRSQKEPLNSFRDYHSRIRIWELTTHGKRRESKGGRTDGSVG